MINLKHWLARMTFVTLMAVAIFFVTQTSLTNVFAQEFDFDQAYQDYQYTYQQYQQAHQEYLTSRDQYLTYQTLTAKTAALTKTREMLEKRDQALETYLTSLRLKLAETTSVIGYQTNLLYLQLDKEIFFLQGHRGSLPSAGTLEDLLSLSAQLEEKYPQTETLAFRSLADILLNKEASLEKEIKALMTDLKTKIQTIKAENEAESLLWERWLLATENKMNRAAEKQKEAGALAQNFDPKKDVSQQFNQAQMLIKESHQYFKEAVFSLEEIIREIKND